MAQKEKHIIKLIVSDVDGTLVNNDKYITPATIQAIADAQADGCEFAIASGRGWNEMEELLTKVPSIRYYICSNGAFVRDALAGQTVFHQSFSNADCVEVMRKLAPLDLYMEVYMGEYVYADADILPRFDEFINPDVGPLIRASRTFKPDFIHFIEQTGQGVEKLQVFYGTQEKKDAVLAMCKGDDRFIVIESSEGNIEFVEPGITKGNAVAALANQLDINAEEVMTMGDSNNDLTMLRYAGVSFGMASGEETAKAAAKYMAEDNHQDGAAKAIQAVLKVNRELRAN